MLKGGESESCACGLRATPNGMGEPTLFLRRLVAVPERTPGFGYRLRYGTGYEPALRCYPALSRERCVQSSLPCVGRVDREVEAPVSPARETVLIPLKPWLQKRLRDGLTAVEIT